MGSIIAAVVGSILNRLRGGLFSNLMRALHSSTGSTVALWLSQQRTQTMRLIWSLPSALLIVYLMSLPSWQIAALTVSFFASMALIGNGDYLDQKRTQPLVDPVGIIRNAIAIAPVCYVEPWLALAYALTGAVHAQIYRLSHNVTGESELAEVLVGALTWATIVLLFQ